VLRRATQVKTGVFLVFKQVLLLGHEPLSFHLLMSRSTKTFRNVQIAFRNRSGILLTVESEVIDLHRLDRM
jgi:hypothetical protein